MAPPTIKSGVVPAVFCRLLSPQYTLTTPLLPLRRATISQPSTVDFLKRLTDQETQRRIANQPKPFSAEEDADPRKQLKNVNFIKPRCADETEINIAVIYRKWKRFSAWI
ncbi:FluG domain-containing protein [Colletotrichum abscissum]|uniref:FluG domain-containing protein n=1 Tax=Colletotrichum abscissum TaxID=1671311 RepID=A0A9Q0B9I5_9PEZI|nr:FluG domain-containing protein [Colletotrichum abscissum]